MNLLEKRSGRLVVFSLLYASEGAPIGFLWWALPTWLRSEGVDLVQITGLTAMLVLPWALKFLWAPAVDALRTARWGFRAWIMVAQLLMGLTLLPLLWLDLKSQLGLASLFLLAHACCAATQDVAVDALVINASPADERGLLNGCMQGGMLLGRSLFGGGVLILADRWGWSVIVFALILSIWSTLTLLLLVREPVVERDANGTRAGLRRFLHTVSEVFRQRRTWLGLAFALVGAAAFEATGALAGPYLVDHGASKAEIGTFLSLVVVGCTLLGGLVGGWCSDRWGRLRSVAGSLGVFVIMILGLAGVEFARPDAGLLVRYVLLAGMYLGVGLFTVSSYALFMDLTDRRLGATQFSTYMAATNGCESWSARLGGQLAAGPGFGVMFLVMSLVSLASLMVLHAIRRSQALKK